MMYITQEKKRLIQSAVAGMTAEKTVKTVLAMVDIEVEEPPILPGVTRGKWYPVEETGDTYLIRGYDDIAYSIGNFADAKVMAASKELVEAVVAWLDSFGVHSSALVRHVVDILEKAGVDVSKYRGRYGGV